ncbi:FHA domain-containing protein [Trichocoleus sp. FACHB-46]|uniref:FHA domain-containing protein n=2 Tax=Trichocoleus TaxID=450526 RepID=A0ABV0JFR4_9CYAN|nr:FHA domain-containing protein [Trichocoleus sp. FACHB-46]MBD1860063.1 FHA domain-containing protein [Trichocoleus sp. FACHB-46]
MASKNSQLLTYIEDTRKIIASDLEEEELQNILYSLDRVTADLNLNKLSIHSVAYDVEVVQSFYSLLGDQKILDDNYQLQFYDLSKLLRQKQQSPHSACLILQKLESEDVKQTLYELPDQQIITVGRKPGSDVCLPNYYTYVSGQHLEIKCYGSENNSSNYLWKVHSSAQCRNGTYINGEQLLGERVLRSGDRIVLGSDSPSSKSPELVFQSIDNSSDKYELKKSVDCDILFFVTDTQLEALNGIGELLSLLTNASVIEFFLVILPSKSSENISVSRYPDRSIELKELKNCLLTLNEKQLGLIKIQRCLAKTILVIDQASEFIQCQQKILQQGIENIEKRQSSKSQKKSGLDINLLIKIINDQKVDFLRSVDAIVQQSKQDLLDDSLAESISYKLQLLIDELEICIVKQKGKQYLELRPRATELDVNDFLVTVCKQELLDWANEEWTKICKQYVNSGLEGLVRTANITLQAVLTANDSEPSLKFRDQVEIEESFQDPLRRINCKIEYQEDPIWTYFIKKIRGFVFQIMGALFLLSFLGLSRSAVIKAINKQVSSSPFLLILVITMLVWLLHKLWKSYQTNKLLEKHKATEKLRQELRTYYQKIIKNRFVDKVVQKLDVTLKNEMSKFDRYIKSALEIASQSSSEVEAAPVDPKVYLKDCQTKAVKLERKIRDLQKVKDKIQRLHANLQSPAGGRVNSIEVAPKNWIGS